MAPGLAASGPYHHAGGAFAPSFVGYGFGGAPPPTYRGGFAPLAGGHVSWGGEQFAGTSESNSALFAAATDVPDSFIASKYMVIFSKTERRQGTKEGYRSFGMPHVPSSTLLVS